MINSRYALNKKELKAFLKTLMKDFSLISPQAAENGDFLFQETKDLDQINLDYDITSNTLKEFFFPERERIFSYQRKGKAIKIMPAHRESAGKSVFFGVRSCDIRAVNFEDRFFAREPKDNLYWQKRNNSILISFACNKPPRESCFCASYPNGPFLEKDEGFDLQFIDATKTHYLIESGTIKGDNFIKKYKRFFKRADENIRDRRSRLKESCLGYFTRKYDILHTYEKLKNIDLTYLWEELGKRCISCGGCEFICPTCFCFYTQDIEYLRAKAERIRAWDSCVFSGYSRIAGDVNPHEKNSDRVSRRFFCKVYNCYNWFKIFACTGCGRCSFVCPVNLDMESFLASLTQANKYQPLLKEL